MPYTRSGSSLPAVFNTRDETLHKQIKNPIAPMFSLSNTITYEVFVNQVLEVLFDQLDQRFSHSQETFDLGQWLQFFAFDVMGTLTFSKRYGFLEKGQDINDMLATIWNYMTDAAPFTQIPWLDEWWRKNQIVATLRGSTGFSILKVVSDNISERQQRVGNTNNDEKDIEVNDRDMLSRFLEVSKTNQSIPSWWVHIPSTDISITKATILTMPSLPGRQQHGPSQTSLPVPTQRALSSKPSCTISAPTPPQCNVFTTSLGP